MDTIEKYRDDYFIDCAEKLRNKHCYKNHVNKFVAYLKMVDLADKIAVIDEKVVEDCIEYYRQEKGELNTRSTMESHLEALKSFYDYLDNSGKAIYFFKSNNYQDFKERIVEKYKLLEPIERGSFSCNQIISILEALEKSIEEMSDTDLKIRDEDRYLQRIILRLFIKLTLIAPAKRNVITQIKMKDFSENYKKVKINNVNVNVPSGLTRDVINAIKFAEKKNSTKIDENTRLFEFIYRYRGDFRGEFLNAWFFNLIKDFQIIVYDNKKKTYPVEPIRNSAIQMMADNMVNPIFVSKVTGITFSSIEALYYKSMEFQYEEYIDKNVNKAIAQNEYYYFI